MKTMFGTILFVLMSTPISSLDWCEVVKPGGHFTGIEIYQRFSGNTSHEISQYLMRNKVGKEWVFEIVFNGNYSIKLSETVSEINDTNIKTKFGVNGIGSTSVNYYRNCIITKDKNEISCESETHSFFTKEQVVIMKPFPSKKLPIQREYVLVFNRVNRTNYWNFELGYFLEKDCTGAPNADKCTSPQFVKQMNDSLFSQIESVVHFESIKDKNSVNKAGHLILFEIEGRPKYCLTFENDPISEQCKYSSKMSTLFDECFKTPVIQTTHRKPDSNQTTTTVSTTPLKTSTQSRSPPMSSNQSTSPLMISTLLTSPLMTSAPTEDPDSNDPLLPYAIGLTLFGVILLIAIIVMLYRRYQNNESETIVLDSDINEEDPTPKVPSSRDTLKGLSKQSLIK